ncbi:hypothetical protein Y032_0125g1278 [Ancylostoma ceylanicum]|uniref:Uncharacterized protein n=1 Tax=Ancylostoma ceylanicum TaxID=53326 RepID=A0A016T914_9BILA|nr:hypothetical protein Y032_0125g1278 [Ancylostoma ceylanicum]
MAASSALAGSKTVELPVKTRSRTAAERALATSVRPVQRVLRCSNRRFSPTGTKRMEMGNGDLLDCKPSKAGYARIKRVPPSNEGSSTMGDDEADCIVKKDREEMKACLLSSSRRRRRKYITMKKSRRKVVKLLLLFKL